MLVTSSELLLQAKKAGSAVAQFNVWNCEMLFGALAAIEQENQPSILATGPSFLPTEKLVFFTNLLIKAANSSSVPIAVHWDHLKSLKQVALARDLGCTSAMIDGSALPLQDNIALTQEAKRLIEGTCISLEGELGYIGAELGNDVFDYTCTTAEDAEAYVSGTGVNALAVSIGNAHGIYKAPPKLNFDALRKITDAVSTPLVLHGGSGIPDSDLKTAIRCGISKINFHAELCQAASAASDGITDYRKRCSASEKGVFEKAVKKLRMVR